MIRMALAAFTLVLLGLGLYFFKGFSSLPDRGGAITDPPAAIQNTEPPVTAISKPNEQVSLSPGPGKKPAPFAGHFEMSVPVRRSAADQAAAMNLVGRSREERFWGLFLEKDHDLSRFVKVHSVQCQGTVCTIEAESIDNDPEHFQSLIYGCLNEHPWVGNKIDVTTLSENPLKARLVFYQEIPK